VTSATVRNRVKLSRHQENRVERSFIDNQAAVHSGPLEGHVCATSARTDSPPEGLLMPPAGRHGFLNSVCEDLINRLAENSVLLPEGLTGLKLR